ncbi:MAG: LysR family transcriptional regulator [Methylocystaceae bacterium]|nr:LysR family transcriptional regulator [Methylocystaceae bacterium]
MHQTNISNIDLNLLHALEALLEEGSVTRAAQAVNLSQPAMSRALDRLRHVLKDPLLVRAGRGMVLTPRAENLKQPVRNAMNGVRGVLSQDHFDPATANVHIRIVGIDYITSLMMPLALERLYQQAPQAHVDIENISEQALQSFKDGEIDLAIGVVDDGPYLTSAYHQALYDEHFVCIMRKDHPLSQQKTLSLNGFTEAAHALLSITGKGGGTIDRRLADFGLNREISLRLPHFLAVHSVIEKTDLITTVPMRLAALYSPDNIVIKELPEEIKGPAFTVSQIWHERFHHDPANKWLRGVVKDVCRLVL